MPSAAARAAAAAAADGDIAVAVAVAARVAAALGGISQHRARGRARAKISEQRGDQASVRARAVVLAVVDARARAVASGVGVVPSRAASAREVARCAPRRGGELGTAQDLAATTTTGRGRDAIGRDDPSRSQAPQRLPRARRRDVRGAQRPRARVQGTPAEAPTRGDVVHPSPVARARRLSVSLLTKNDEAGKRNASARNGA